MERVHINKITKYWQFVLDNRNRYEKEVGRYMTLDELKTRADLDWATLSSEEKKVYHLKAKQANKEARKQGLRFKKKPAWVKRRDGLLYQALEEETEADDEEDEEGDRVCLIRIQLHMRPKQ